MRVGKHAIEWSPDRLSDDSITWARKLIVEQSKLSPPDCWTKRSVIVIVVVVVCVYLVQDTWLQAKSDDLHAIRQLVAVLVRYAISTVRRLESPAL